MSTAPRRTRGPGKAQPGRASRTRSSSRKGRRAKPSPALSLGLLGALALGAFGLLTCLDRGSKVPGPVEPLPADSGALRLPLPPAPNPQEAPPSDGSSTLPSEAPAETPDSEGLAAQAALLALLPPEPSDAGTQPKAAPPRVAHPLPPTGTRRGPLIIVIDDAGHNLTQLEPFLRLPFPLTVAVLPGLPHSAEAAAAVRRAGKELILHQPMEALGGEDPGPGAIRLGMTPTRAAALVRANLDSLPGVRGLNNHEGSAVSQDTGLMAAVLGVAKSRGIYYLDSLTTADSVAPTLASQVGIRPWERDVFLDNSPDRVSIIRSIDLGKRKALKGGATIMIGHVWSADLAQTLADLYPGLVAEGFSLSTISKVMLEETDAGPGD